MTTNPLTRVVLAGVLLAPAPTLADEPVQETRPAKPDGSVEVRTVSGHVHVRGWDKDELQVRGEVDGRIRITGDPERLVVRAVDGDDDDDGGHARLEVRVPRGCRVEVGTVSAEVVARDLTGPLEVRSVSGDIEVRGDPKTLRTKTLSGRVTLAGSKRRTETKTVSGDVTLRGAGGEVRISTVSGDIEVDGKTFQQGRVASVSGDITFSGGLAADGELELKSHSGSVELRVPAGLSAELRLSTFSGSIDNELAGQAGAETRGDKVRHRLGTGTARVSVRSFSGEIRLRHR